MTCKDCIHYDVCEAYSARDTYATMHCAEECVCFFDRDGWVNLPCKLGDTLYTNFSMSGQYLRAKDRPYSVKVVFIGINSSPEMGGGFVNVEYEKNGHMFSFTFADFGKRVFLTRKEAKKALKEMERE